MKRNNKKVISTELVEFFPMSKTKALQKIVVRSRWPLLIGLACAAVVAVGMVIGSGGIVIPGAAFLGGFKTALAMWAKRLVISASSIVGFGIGFGLAKKFGLGKEEPVPDYVRVVQESYYHRLNNPVKISNVRQEFITQYCHAEDSAFVSFRGRETSYPIERSRLFLPLRNSIHFQEKNKPAKVTHYREDDDSFLVFYPNQKHECTVTRGQIDGILRSSMV